MEDWREHRLRFEQLILSELGQIYNDDTQLAEKMQQECCALVSLKPLWPQLQQVLHKIKVAAKKDDFKCPNSCFISYAWPSDSNKGREFWLQLYLKILRSHLREAGINAELDIMDNPLGSNIYGYMDKIEKADKIMLVGTQSLLEKHKLGTKAVCTELNLINKKRTEQGDSGCVVPILLTGDYFDSFPPYLIMYTNIIDCREISYLRSLKEIIRSLYGLSLDHKCYNKIWAELEGGKDKALQLLVQGSAKDIVDSYYKTEQKCLAKIGSERHSSSTDLNSILGSKFAYIDKLEKAFASKEVIKNLLRENYIKTAEVQCVFYDVPIAIDKIFINLAIVENSKQREREKEVLEPGAEEFAHQRLSSFEEIYGAESAIEVRDIFKERFGDEEKYKKALILGRAGIGKTTLCKHIAHQWSHGKLWSDKFDLIFWIPLRNLSRASYQKSKKLSLAEVILRECFNNQGIEKEEIERILSSNNNILFLLDGFDEVSHLWSPDGSAIDSEPGRIIDQLLRHEYTIVTSRPYYVHGLPNDRVLENIGFVDKNIDSYVDNFFTVLGKANLAKELKKFLEANSTIRGVGHIPIMLELLCGFWEQGYDVKSKMSDLTITELYMDLTYKLYRRFLQHSGAHKLKRKIRNLRKGMVEKLCKPAEKFLEELAYNQMQRQALIISRKEISRLLDKHETGDIDLLDDVLKMGFLRAMNEGEDEEQKEYYFIHLTFQEFFAARYLAKIVAQDGFQEFVEKYKYIPRYQIVWGFIAGILHSRGEIEGLNIFFERLLNGPRDLMGSYEAALLAICMEEARYDARIKLKGKLVAYLRRWMLVFLGENCTVNLPLKGHQHAGKYRGMHLFFKLVGGLPRTLQELNVIEILFRSNNRCSIHYIEWLSKRFSFTLDALYRVLSDKDKIYEPLTRRASFAYAILYKKDELEFYKAAEIFFNYEDDPEILASALGYLHDYMVLDQDIKAQFIDLVRTKILVKKDIAIQISAAKFLYLQENSKEAIEVLYKIAANNAIADKERLMAAKVLVEFNRINAELLSFLFRKIPGEYGLKEFSSDTDESSSQTAAMICLNIVKGEKGIVSKINDVAIIDILFNELWVDEAVPVCLVCLEILTELAKTNKAIVSRLLNVVKGTGGDKYVYKYSLRFVECKEVELSENLREIGKNLNGRGGLIYISDSKRWYFLGGLSGGGIIQGYISDIWRLREIANIMADKSYSELKFSSKDKIKELLSRNLGYPQMSTVAMHHAVVILYDAGIKNDELVNTLFGILQEPISSRHATAALYLARLGYKDDIVVKTLHKMLGGADGENALVLLIKFDKVDERVRRILRVKLRWHSLEAERIYCAEQIALLNCAEDEAMIDVLCKTLTDKSIKLKIAAIKTLEKFININNRLAYDEQVINALCEEMTANNEMSEVRRYVSDIFVTAIKFNPGLKNILLTKFSESNNQWFKVGIALLFNRIGVEEKIIIDELYRLVMSDDKGISYRAIVALHQLKKYYHRTLILLRNIFVKDRDDCEVFIQLLHSAQIDYHDYFPSPSSVDYCDNNLDANYAMIKDLLDEAWTKAGSDIILLKAYLKYKKLKYLGNFVNRIADNMDKPLWFSKGKIHYYDHDKKYCQYELTSSEQQELMIALPKAIYKKTDYLPTLNAKKQKWLIDTDAADDDWQAIIYMLQHPDVEVIGITIAGTGMTEPKDGARHIEALLNKMQINIPVAYGEDLALDGQHVVPQKIRTYFKELGKKFLSLKEQTLSQEGAVKLLLEKILASKDPVSILAIGPLTNIALAIKKAPEIIAKIKEIVIMGGAIEAPGNLQMPHIEEIMENQYAEWNFYFDPLAVKKVFNSGIAIRLVPLDATNQVPVSKDFIMQIKRETTSSSAKLIADVLEQATANPAAQIYFWDQLAAVSAASPEICKWKEMKLKIVIKSETESLQRKRYNGKARRFFDKKETGRIIAAEDGRVIKVCYQPNKIGFQREFISTVNNR